MIKRIEYIDTKGELVNNDNPLIEYKIVAKKVITADEVTNESMVRFFLKRVKGRLVDVKGLSDRQIKSIDGKFVLVSEEIFNKYLDWVNNKTRTPLSSIERMI